MLKILTSSSVRLELVQDGNTIDLTAILPSGKKIALGFFAVAVGSSEKLYFDTWAIDQDGREYIETDNAGLLSVRR